MTVVAHDLDSNTSKVLCKECRLEFSTEALFCPNCGTAKNRKVDGDPILGTTVGDRYQIIEQIGQGASGAIFRAEHVTLRRKVAVKVLHHELSRDDLAIERFRRAATTVGEIDNDHIVQIYDFGRTFDGRLYLAMEYLEGQTLSQILKGRGTLSTQESVDILVQLGEALIEAHSMGYVHRDLRPRNLFLSVRRNTPNFLKLLDFGLAKLVEHEGEAASTSLGMTFGDPHYMSPEQAKGEPVDRRADIYSMGCIAYEMLTGHPPFHGGKVFDVLTRHVNETPPTLAELAPDTPAWLERAVMRCLGKKADERYITVYRFVEALRQGTDSGVIMTDAVARRAPTDPQGQTNPTAEPAKIPTVLGVQAASPNFPEPSAKEQMEESADAEQPFGEQPVDAPEVSTAAGLSEVWYADGEAGDFSEDSGGTAQVKLNIAKARQNAGKGSTGVVAKVDEEFFDEFANKPLKKVALGVGAAIVVLVLAIVLWPSEEEGPGGKEIASAETPVVAVPVPTPAVATDPGSDEVLVPDSDSDSDTDSPPIKGDTVIVRPEKNKVTRSKRKQKKPPRLQTPKRDDSEPIASKSVPVEEAPTVANADKEQAKQLTAQGTEDFRAGDILGAAGKFNKARSLDPRNGLAIAGLGEIALSQGAYDAAIGHLEKASRLLPKSSRVWILLGEAYLGLGNSSSAANAFKKALKIRPDNARAREGFNEASGL